MNESIKKVIENMSAEVRAATEEDVEAATKIVVEAYRSRPQHAQRPVVILMSALQALLAIMDEKVVEEALPLAQMATPAVAALVMERAHARLSAS